MSVDCLGDVALVCRVRECILRTGAGQDDPKTATLFSGSYLKLCSQNPKGAPEPPTSPTKSPVRKNNRSRRAEAKKATIELKKTTDTKKVPKEEVTSARLGNSNENVD
jgi:hypothetical protein